jgi:hypothetical protein
MEGEIAPALVRAAQAGGEELREVDDGGSTSLVARYTVRNPGDGAPVADIVMARRFDVGALALLVLARRPDLT